MMFEKNNNKNMSSSSRVIKSDKSYVLIVFKRISEKSPNLKFRIYYKTRWYSEFSSGSKVEYYEKGILFSPTSLHNPNYECCLYDLNDESASIFCSKPDVKEVIVDFVSKSKLSIDKPGYDKTFKFVLHDTIKPNDYIELLYKLFEN